MTGFARPSLTTRATWMARVGRGRGGTAPGRRARDRVAWFAGRCGKWLGLFVLGTLALLTWVLVCMYVGVKLGEIAADWFGS